VSWRCSCGKEYKTCESFLHHLGMRGNMRHHEAGRAPYKRKKRLPPEPTAPTTTIKYAKEELKRLKAEFPKFHKTKR